MKLKVVSRKIYNYIRYDLKEIAFPSSLPDPPHIKKRRKLTWKEQFLVLKEASGLYVASWTRDLGPALRPNDYKKEETKNKHIVGQATKEREPSILEDLELLPIEIHLEALSKVIKKEYKKSWRRRKVLNKERALRKHICDLSKRAMLYCYFEDLASVFISSKALGH